MARRLGPAVITMIVVDVVLVAVLIALMATAPRGDDATAQESATNPAAPTAPAEPEEGATTPSSTQALTVPEGAVEVAEFSSPTGNIWCTIGDDSASCQIGDTSYQPPSVEGCADNDLVGRVLTVTDERAEFPCPDGGVPGPAAGDREVLAYDEVSAVGNFMCTSTERGMRCESLVSGHGFTVARAGATTF